MNPDNAYAILKPGMKQGRGYTILEVMIFLAISGFMLIAAMVAIGGRQQEVQFQQAARDFEDKINDLISDVEVGYFVRDAQFGCRAVGTADPVPEIFFESGESGNVQGESGDCVLVGKTIIMGDEAEISTSDVSDKGVLRIYDMAGVRLVNATTKEAAQDIEQMKPVPLSLPDVDVDTYNLRYGLEVEKVVRYDQDSPPQEESSKAVSIMNNAKAGTEIVEGTDASLSAGSTSAKVVMSTFSSATAGSGINDFVNTWRYAGDGETREFTSIVICVSGPDARGISGTVTGWNHRQTAALVIQKNGNTQLIFDGAEEYCA